MLSIDGPGAAGLEAVAGPAAASAGLGFCTAAAAVRAALSSSRVRASSARQAAKSARHVASSLATCSRTKNTFSNAIQEQVAELCIELHALLLASYKVEHHSDIVCHQRTHFFLVEHGQHSRVGLHANAKLDVRAHLLSFL